MASSLATIISPVSLSNAIHPRAHPASSRTLGGWPWPLPAMIRVDIRFVVVMYSVVTAPTRVSKPVIGSCDSKTMRCRAPRSCIKSPRMTVTDPFAKPTAICDKSSKAATADILGGMLTNYPRGHIRGVQLTGNRLLALFTETVDRHRGVPVFFSLVSSAHTFKTGSLGISSVIVTSSAVPYI